VCTLPLGRNAFAVVCCVVLWCGEKWCGVRRKEGGAEGWQGVVVRRRSYEM
jgi:hypothetical protein